MPRKPSAKATKSEIVAFKVEEELAEFLNRLPNKSDFIRNAILAQFSMTCPLCTGTGVVPRGVHDHYKPLVGASAHKPCEKCKSPVEFPLSADAVPAADQKRLEQFLDGGALYCGKCYASVPACDDCGWHVPMGRKTKSGPSDRANAESFPADRLRPPAGRRRVVAVPHRDRPAEAVPSWVFCTRSRSGSSRSRSAGC
jgi:hypothetical protein